MIRLILFTIACIIMLALPSHSDDTMTPQEAYIRHFLRNYPGRMEKALELLPVIDGYSALHAIEPMLTTATISAESGFQTDAHNPEHGERGLMQVHGVCSWL